MIEIAQGDLFAADVQALVNAVNCRGVMGAGLALQFKHRFPAYFEDYRRACAEGRVTPGAVHVFRLPDAHWILSVPTKRHWRSRSRLQDVRSGVTALVAAIDAHGIESIAIPALGCGLGGLDWEVVRPIIEAALAPAQTRALLFAPRAPQITSAARS